MKQTVAEGKKKHTLLKRILVCLATLLAAAAIAFGIYTSVYYRADNTALEYLHTKAVDGGADVEIRELKDGWLFDGPSTENAVIFYPGAKVDAAAYAPILSMTAAKHADCFLVKMPFHLAFFGINKAAEIQKDFPGYKNWYIGGHSLGGAMAGVYAAKHLDSLRGAIFLAAYPTSSLQQDGFRALSIYGSQDQVLNMSHYEEDLKYMPYDFTEVVIGGGNHAQFGSYGFQKGDGAAEISAEDQWKQTADAITDFIR